VLVIEDSTIVIKTINTFENVFVEVDTKEKSKYIIKVYVYNAV
jgi:hypothetical protein